MKKIVLAALLSTFVAAPAIAAGSGASVGVNYGLDFAGTVGIEGEFDISKQVNQPVAIQAFYKSYSNPYLTLGWDYTTYGAAAIYDLTNVVKLGDRKMKPYAGLGFYSGSVSCTNCGVGWTGWAAASPSGVYFTGGLRYSLTDTLDADFSYNNIAGFTVGGRFNF